MILQLYYSDFRETINFSIHLNFLFLNFCHYTMYCFKIADFKYFIIVEQSFLESSLNIQHPGIINDISRTILVFAVEKI